MHARLHSQVLLVQTVLSCEPDEVSFLYFLHYVRASGGVGQLADGEGGAQTWRLRGGAQQLCLGLAQQVQALGGQVMLGAVVRRIEAGAGFGCGHRAGAEPGVSHTCTDTCLHENGSGRYDGTGVGNDGECATGDGSGSSGSSGDGGSSSGSGSSGGKGGNGGGGGTGQGRARPAGAGGTSQQNTEQGLTVHLAGGGKLHARHVILALPPPVWSTMAFDPQLPEAKQKLGQHMFMVSGATHSHTGCQFDGGAGQLAQPGPWGKCSGILRNIQLSNCLIMK